MSRVISFVLGVLIGIVLVVSGLQWVDLRSEHGFCGSLEAAMDEVLPVPITRTLKVVFKWFAWPVRTFELAWDEGPLEPAPLYLYDLDRGTWQRIPSGNPLDDE